MSGTTDFTSTTRSDRVFRWECKHVDGSAFAPDVEGRFSRGVPTVRSDEGNDLLDEPRVPGIEQPFETLTLPEQPHVDTSPKCARHRDQRVHCDPIRSTALDAPDDRTRYRCATCKPLLRHATTASKRSYPKAEPNDVHLARVPTPAKPPVIRLDTGRGPWSWRSSSAPAGRRPRYHEQTDWSVGLLEER